MAERKRTKLAEEAPGKKVSRLAGLGGSGGVTGEFDWSAGEPFQMASVVVAVTRRGGLASFGRTRDGGAGTVTIFLDDEKSTVYIKADSDVYGELEKIVGFLDSL